MRYLILMTLIWAFSFSFIGEVLAGQVDSYFAVLVRIGLASLVFLPFTKFRGVPTKLKLKIMLIGSVQIGFMSFSVGEELKRQCVQERLQRLVKWIQNSWSAVLEVNLGTYTKGLGEEMRLCNC